MNISLEKHEQILSSGLLVDHYFILALIKQEAALPKHHRVRGFINLLKKREYLNEEEELTEKALALLADIKKPNTKDYSTELLEKLKAKFKESTGKNQVKGFGNVYFIPSEKEMKDHLTRFERDFHPTRGNEEKIEAILFEHLEKCIGENQYAPAIKYFIHKDGGSALASALENWEEPEEQSTYKMKVI
jgi:uncharacterized membrane protein YheB (UPF0754 family)